MPRDWVNHFKTLWSGPHGDKFKEAFPDNCMIQWLDTLEITEAVATSDKTGRIVVRFAVTSTYVNIMGTLQGGLQSAMFDIVSSWVFHFTKGWNTMGTTRTLNVSYLRPAPLGEVLLMECELVHAGKRLGMSRGVLRREKDGAIISLCEHHKYNAAADQPKV